MTKQVVYNVEAAANYRQKIIVNYRELWYNYFEFSNYLFYKEDGFMFERLYDTLEQTQVNYIGYVSENAKYDFAIVHTSQFFGKHLVICMQTGRSALISYEDLSDHVHLKRAYNIGTMEEAQELSIFLQYRLDSMPYKEQYT